VAFRWTSAGLVSLPHLTGMNHTDALAISGNGLIVTGISNSSPFSGPHAVLHTPATGLVDLNVYLPMLGVDLTGWDLSEARCISADGKTITGTGTQAGHSEAWLVRLGACQPCDANCDGASNASDVATFVNLLLTTTPSPCAPCAGDGN